MSEQFEHPIDKLEAEIAQQAEEIAALKTELERAREVLIFEWCDAAVGCWLRDVVNVRHEAAARYEREIVKGGACTQLNS